jgi:hypothetical protein
MSVELFAVFAFLCGLIGTAVVQCVGNKRAAPKKVQKPAGSVKSAKSIKSSKSGKSSKARKLSKSSKSSKKLKKSGRSSSKASY